MSVRGLVTVVIGVFFREGAPLEQSRGNQTPLSQGKLNSIEQANPELAEANSFGQVQRLYTGHPSDRMKRKSTPIGNYGINVRSLCGN